MECADFGQAALAAYSENPSGFGGLNCWSRPPATKMASMGDVASFALTGSSSRIGSRRCDMASCGGCCGGEAKFEGLSSDYKRRLWAVIIINAGMFFIETGGGSLAGSKA